jgi:hypothetical protein
MDEQITCSNAFHVDGCAGSAGGEHELRRTGEVWCSQCDQPTAFAVRMPYGIEALCAFHGLELAQDALAYSRRRAEGGIEQYQAESR